MVLEIQFQLLNRQETRSVKHGESDLLTIPQGKDCSDIN